MPRYTGINNAKLVLQGLLQHSQCQENILQIITTPPAACTIHRMKQSRGLGCLYQILTLSSGCLKRKWLFQTGEHLYTLQGFSFADIRPSVVSSSCLTGVEPWVDFCNVAHPLQGLKSCAFCNVSLSIASSQTSLFMTCLTSLMNKMQETFVFFPGGKPLKSLISTRCLVHSKIDFYSCVWLTEQNKLFVNTVCLIIWIIRLI